jgi:tRNA threonylcarbamoyladenosine biosynthesis protein TsaB
MAVILNIDTALDTASVCLTRNGEQLGLLANERQKDHAAWLHTAVRDLLKAQSIDTAQLSAVAVSIGPGSYTGLRIGLSAAKGLCYALGIPLITVGTLEVIAAAAKEDETDLICPLIDARRMEVFAAVYNKLLQEIVEPMSLILTKNSFSNLLLTNRILFCGNGRNKLQSVLCHENATYSDSKATAADLGHLANKYWEMKRFANLAYTEPLYVKEFYSPGH